jgi:hypothetical protein
VAQPPDPSGNNGRRAHGNGGTPDADDSTTTEATTGENAPGASDNRQRNGNGHGRPHDTTTTGQTTTTEASQHPSATAPGRIKHTTTTSATPD